MSIFTMGFIVVGAAFVVVQLGRVALMLSGNGRGLTSFAAPVKPYESLKRGILIYGEPGLGKTKTVADYAKPEMANVQVVGPWRGDRIEDYNKGGFDFDKYEGQVTKDETGKIEVHMRPTEVSTKAMDEFLGV